MLEFLRTIVQDATFDAFVIALRNLVFDFLTLVSGGAL